MLWASACLGNNLWCIDLLFLRLDKLITCCKWASPKCTLVLQVNVAKAVHGLTSLYSRLEASSLGWLVSRITKCYNLWSKTTQTYALVPAQGQSISRVCCGLLMPHADRYFYHTHVRCTPIFCRKSSWVDVLQTWFVLTLLSILAVFLGCKKPRAEHTCPCCHSGQLEDEKHVLYEGPVY